MKSNKQRRLEIKARRRKRAEAEALKIDLYKRCNTRPLYSVEADLAALEHNNIYGILPLFYVDKPFTCKDCGAKEVWTAKSQKWWYEIAKGNIDSTAIHCNPCRVKRRKEKEQAKIRMEEIANREPHPNEAFFRKRY